MLTFSSQPVRFSSLIPFSDKIRDAGEVGGWGFNPELLLTTLGRLSFGDSVF
jgi:hypothetical protein